MAKKKQQHIFDTRYQEFYSKLAWYFLNGLHLYSTALPPQTKPIHTNPNTYRMDPIIKQSTVLSEG